MKRRWVLLQFLASAAFGCSGTSSSGDAPDVGTDGQIDGSDGASDANDVLPWDDISSDDVDEDVSLKDVSIQEDAEPAIDVELMDEVEPAGDVPPANDVEPDAEQDVGPACTPQGCDDEDPCTVDSCAADGSCVHTPSDGASCCKPSLFFADFEADSPIVFELDNTSETVGWQVIPAGAPLALEDVSAALYYGNTSTWNYGTGEASNAGTAVSSPIALPKNTKIELSFSAVVDIETFPQADYFSVTVQDDGGSYQVLTKEQLTLGKERETVEVDLSAWAGKSIRIGFSFDTFDEIQNDSFGILIDDLAVTSSCAVPACAESADCDDEIAATNQSCANGACTYEIAESECAVDSDCDDQNECTTDSCDLSGPIALCVNGAQLGCCATDADCDDDDPCTTNTCDVAASFCESEPVEGCCNVDLDCADGDKCTSDACGDDNTCTHGKICCNSVDDCGGQNDTCQVNACVAGACLSAETGADGCCVAFDYYETFEDGAADGWTLSPLSSAPGGQKFGWQVWNDPPVPGASASLYYGNTSLKNYGEGLDSEGSATTGPIALPAGGRFTLSFEVFWGVELLAAYDVLEVFVDEGVGAAPQLVWAKPDLPDSQQDTFTKVAVDVSAYAGKTITIAFLFGTADATINETLGILLDDVRVSADCLPGACTLDADCADGNPLTAESCVSGKCFSGPALACASSLDCDDDDVCTSDICLPEGTCQNTAQLGGCCQTDSDCKDQAPNACSVGVCKEAASDPVDPFEPLFDKECVFTPKADCCLDDSDCGDGNACTIDSCNVLTNECIFESECCEEDASCNDDSSCTLDACVDGQCLRADTNASECCTPFSVTENFDDGAANDWTLVNGSSSAGWSVWTTPAVGTSPALYYGSTTAQNFAPGKKTSGNAFTDFFTLPADQETRLSFTAHLDIDPDLDEFFTDSDTLTVLAVGDDMDAVVLWESKASTKLAETFKVQVNLDAFAGKTVRLQFRFQAAAAGNAGLGVLIDDVAILSCQENACDSDADCDDGDPSTTAFCKAGMCYEGPALPDCEVDAECDDGEACTIDVCKAGKCRNPLRPFCCTTDIECSDGESVCSTDLCVEGVCLAWPTGASGCCTPNAATEAFDDADLPGWTIDNDTVGIGWQVVTPPEAVWPSSVLYYGVPEQWNFEYLEGPTSGVVRTAPFTVPNGDSSATIAFKVYMDTESTENFDLLEVRIISGDQVSRVLTKAQLTQKTWVQVAGSLTPWAGKEIVVEFSFETVDNTVNQGLGILIDDFELATTCTITSCSANADCDDENTDTQEICTTGKCAYGSSLAECAVDADCGDGDACSTDECVGGVCVSTPIPQCISE